MSRISCSRARGRIRAQQRAAQAAVFVDAGGVVGAAAVADGDLAALEVADELGPFGVGGGAVFLAGAQRAAAGDVGAVAVDHFFGVDGLVSHGGVDVAVAGDGWAMCGGMPCAMASVMNNRRKPWKV